VRVAGSITSAASAHRARSDRLLLRARTSTTALGLDPDTRNPAIDRHSADLPGAYGVS
jgi:hypothetical protein